MKLRNAPTLGDARGIRAFREAHPTLRHGHGLVIAPCASAYPLAPHIHARSWDAA